MDKEKIQKSISESKKLEEASHKKENKDEAKTQDQCTTEAATEFSRSKVEKAKDLQEVAKTQEFISKAKESKEVAKTQECISCEEDQTTHSDKEVPELEVGKGQKLLEETKAKAGKQSLEDNEEDEKVIVADKEIKEDDDITRKYESLKKAKHRGFIMSKILDSYKESDVLVRVEPIYDKESSVAYKVCIYKILIADKYYVIKAVTTTKEIATKIAAEYDTMKKLGDENPYFIKAVEIQKVALDSFWTRIEMLMEYGGRPLIDLMSEATEQTIQIWMIQSLAAFRYSEKRRISHFDIKPLNIVFQKGILKVIDLGCAIEFEKKSLTQDKLGEKKKDVIGFTNLYSPPEIIKSDRDLAGLISEKFDVYCWGMSFFQLVAKISCKDFVKFREEENYNVFLEKIKSNKKMQSLNSKHIILKIILGCLEYKPEKRLTFDEIDKIMGGLESAIYEKDIEAARRYITMGKNYTKYSSDYDLAIELHKKGRKIYKKALGKEHPKVAYAYRNIGKVYYRMNKHNIAYVPFLKALRIHEKAFGENSIKVAKNCDNLGNIYINTGETEKAVNYITRGLKIYESVLGADSTKVACSYADLSHVHFDLEEYETAISYLEKALNIRKKHVGEGHISLAPIYGNIGNIYRRIGDIDSAIIQFEKSTQVYENAYGTNSLEIADIYKKMGSIFKSLDEQEKAFNYYEKALKIHEKLLGKDHACTAGSYYDIGEMYHRKKEFEIALQYYKEAQEIYEKEHSFYCEEAISLEKVMTACRKELAEQNREENEDQGKDKGDYNAMA